MTTPQTPTYTIEIDGTPHELDTPTISVADIRRLGGIPADVPVVEEDPQGNERSLGEHDRLEIKPGHRVGRSPRYRRG